MPYAVYILPKLYAVYILPKLYAVYILPMLDAFCCSSVLYTFCCVPRVLPPTLMSLLVKFTLVVRCGDHCSILVTCMLPE